MRPTENETWVIEAGDAVVRKKAFAGLSALRPTERLIYCLWVADYGMRNTGNLETASDLYAQFQEEAIRLAKELSLEFTLETFSLPKESLEIQFFDRFERVCNEIKKA
jgi:hypothetical protein